MEQRSQEYWEDYGKRWEMVFKEVELNLDADPEGKVGMLLAEKRFALVDEVYKDQPILSQKIWKGYKSGVTPEHHPEYRMEVIGFMEIATRKFKAKNKNATKKICM